jgi:hypothetical protein
METEDTISHNSSHGKVVKGVGEVLPDVCIAVFSKTFIIESIAARMMRLKGPNE